MNRQKYKASPKKLRSSEGVEGVGHAPYNGGNLGWVCMHTYPGDYMVKEGDILSKELALLWVQLKVSLS